MRYAATLPFFGSNCNHGQRRSGAVGRLDDGLATQFGIARNLAEVVGHADEGLFDDGVHLELERDARAVHALRSTPRGLALHVLEHFFLGLEGFGFDLQGAAPGQTVFTLIVGVAMSGVS